MILVTFNTADAWLLDDAPEWGRANVVVDATIPSDNERGLTGRETRRQTGDTLRLAVKWTSLITSATKVTNLRNALQQYGQNAGPPPAMQAILCPFWPGRFAPGVTPPVTTAFYVTFTAAGVFNAIYAAASIGAQSAALAAYPLLVGILKELPEVVLLTSDDALVEFQFAENDSSFVTPPAFVPPVGIDDGSGNVRPVFPFAANWVTSPHSGEAEYDITRQQIGEIRALSEVYYTQRNRRRVQQSLTLRASDPLNLLSFFAQMGGQVATFWLPANLKEAFLTANVASTDTALHVDNGTALGTNTFLCLNNGATRLPLIVTGVAGSQWNLSGAVGQNFSAATTGIESLVLARFDAIKITINFVTSTWARVQLKFKELPWETAAVAGEVIGTTMGALPATAMLYTFTLTTPGANTIYRFTNYERNLTNGGHTYISAAIENEDIQEAPNLERQNVNLKMRNAPGNPLALLVPFQLEFPLEIEIDEATVAGNAATIVTTFFSGEVGEVNVDGPFLAATCMSLNWMFDRTAVRRLYQNNDNWNLFEPSNGLTASDWQWNALVVSYNAAACELVIGTITANNAGLNGGTSLVVNYFAAGYLAVTTGGVSQYRMVSQSGAKSAGQIILQLASPLIVAPGVGDAVAVFAGYDGQYETAIAKFANGSNFGGFPFIPIGNPFVLKITQNPGGGKK